MSHHGELVTQIIKSNLCIIAGTNNADSIKLPRTTMMGDRGYDEREFLEYADKAEMGWMTTTKRGPSLCFKFGNTKYKTCREQRDISENGPVLCLGATRAYGDLTSHLVAYRNGTGRVTFLQSSDPDLSYGNIEYVLQYKEIEYAKTFEKALNELSDAGGYDPTSLLSGKDFDMRYYYDSRNVYQATKGQGGREWLFMRPFHMVSTLSHAAIPREREMLSTAEATLIELDLGLRLNRGTQTLDMLEFQTQSTTDLKKLSNAELINICKEYGRPHSGRNKAALVEAVQLGPKEAAMTEFEKVIKHTLLAPLKDKDRAAHKLGSLNEDDVRSVINSIVLGLLRLGAGMFIRVWISMQQDV